MPKKTAYVPLLTIALTVLLPLVASATCGGSATCADVSNTLIGNIDVGAITISWSTDDESSSVDFYVLRRYDCQTPNTCSVFVTTINAVGSCSTNEDYSYEDYPPTPLSSWTYTVEVWSTGGVRSCAIDVVPE